MEQTRDIPRTHWERYFRSISDELHNHPVRVELLDRELGEQVVGDRLPLQEISCDLRQAEGGTVEISMETDGGSFSHRIGRPLRVQAQEVEGGRLACLDIEEEGGRKTLVFFEPMQGEPARPGAPG